MKSVEMAFAQVPILDAVTQHVVDRDELAVADGHDGSFSSPAPGQTVALAGEVSPRRLRIISFGRQVAERLGPDYTHHRSHCPLGYPMLNPLTNIGALLASQQVDEAVAMEIIP